MGRLDLPDKYRDEDEHNVFGYQLDVYDCIRVAEIGSEAWIKAELAAGRSGEERDA